MNHSTPLTFVIYGISDCPACLRACADSMEFYPRCEYVFVNTDFSKSYRENLKKKYGMNTFPIIVVKENDCESLVGGYAELTSFITNHAEYEDYSAPISEKKTEPT